MGLVRSLLLETAVRTRTTTEKPLLHDEYEDTSEKSQERHLWSRGPLLGDFLANKDRFKSMHGPNE